MSLTFAFLHSCVRIFLHFIFLHPFILPHEVLSHFSMKFLHECKAMWNCTLLQAACQLNIFWTVPDRYPTEKEKETIGVSYLERDISNNSQPITFQRFYCARKFSFMHEERCSRKVFVRRLADKWTHLKSICEIDRPDCRPCATANLFSCHEKVVILEKTSPKWESAERRNRESGSRGAK